MNRYHTKDCNSKRGSQYPCDCPNPVKTGTEIEPMTADKLLPCPFCGSSGEAESDGESHPHMPQPNSRIRCSSGDCFMVPAEYTYTNLEDAITAWNTRTQPRTMEGDRLNDIDRLEKETGLTVEDALRTIARGKIAASAVTDEARKAALGAFEAEYATLKQSDGTYMIDAWAFMMAVSLHIDTIRSALSSPIPAGVRDQIIRAINDGPLYGKSLKLKYAVRDAIDSILLPHSPTQGEET